jgi:multicomponent Na+:H+ antiporter subunit E
MPRLLSSMLVLVVAWALWSGHGEPLIVGFGALSCLAVFGISQRMARVVGEEPLDYGLALRSVTYLPWLLLQVLKSNLDVVRLIIRLVLGLESPVHSHLIRVQAGQSTELGRVIYANSITLTPGTITLDVRGEGLLVHALTRSAAEGIQQGEMDRRVSALEGRG